MCLIVVTHLTCSSAMHRVETHPHHIDDGEVSSSSGRREKIHVSCKETSPSSLCCLIAMLLCSRSYNLLEHTSLLYYWININNVLKKCLCVFLFHHRATDGKNLERFFILSFFGSSQEASSRAVQRERLKRNKSDCRTTTSMMMIFKGDSSFFVRP